MAQPKSKKGRKPVEVKRKQHLGDEPSGGKSEKQGYTRADRRKSKSWLHRILTLDFS